MLSGDWMAVDAQPRLNRAAAYLRPRRPHPPTTRSMFHVVFICVMLPNAVTSAPCGSSTTFDYLDAYSAIAAALAGVLAAALASLHV